MKDKRGGTAVSSSSFRLHPSSFIPGSFLPTFTSRRNFGRRGQRMTLHATAGVRGGGAAVVCAVLLALAGGCSTTRTFTIYSRPASARLFIDGEDRGTGPITQDFKFTGPTNVHHVRAVAPGHETITRDIWPDTPESSIVVELRPLGKRVVV